MKKTELKRKTAMQRKTPIARKKPSKPTKTLKTSTIPKKKPATAAAQYAQKRALNIRSGGRCEMEVAVQPYATGPSIWARCTRFGKDPAHIYTRPKCGKARDLVDAVVLACRPCHEASGGKLATATVRVPLRRAIAAWWLILEHTKLGAPGDERMRIHKASVGECPEQGVEPYG